MFDVCLMYNFTGPTATTIRTFEQQNSGKSENYSSLVGKRKWSAKESGRQKKQGKNCGLLYHQNFQSSVVVYKLQKLIQN